MNKPRYVFKETSRLYRDSDTSMGKWMWQYHVLWVARRSRLLAKKYSASEEIVCCAALLHDIADSKFERTNPEFDSWGWKAAKEILKRSGYRRAERDEILEAIRTHSCHPGQLPKTIEGKVLSTADGMWHLETDFFSQICFMNRPQGIDSYDQWQQWFMRKIERDYNTKIFFEDEKVHLESRYASLMDVFGSK